MQIYFCLQVHSTHIFLRKLIFILTLYKILYLSFKAELLNKLIQKKDYDIVTKNLFHQTMCLN